VWCKNHTVLFIDKMSKKICQQYGCKNEGKYRYIVQIPLGDNLKVKRVFACDRCIEDVNRHNKKIFNIIFIE